MTVREVGLRWAQSGTARHKTLRVLDAEWLGLHKAIKVMEGSLQGGSPDGLSYILPRARFCLAAMPFPLNDEYVWGGDPAEVIQRLRGYGQIYEMADTLSFCEVLDRALEQGIENPMWLAFKANWQSMARPAVILAHRPSTVSLIEKMLASLPDASSVIVAGESEARETWNRKTTVVFGPPSIYPKWLRTYPHNDVLWIYNSWNKDPQVSESILVSPHGARTTVQVEHLGGGSTNVYAPEPALDVEDLGAQLSQERIASEIRRHLDQEDSAVVSARIALLATDDYVLLPIDDGTFVTIFDPNEGRVRREQAKRMVPGMFVVTRDGGSHDHIRTLVDEKFMKDSKRARAQLVEWKGALRRRISASGLDRVRLDLRELGVSAEPATVNLWTTDLIHGPGNEQWFRALLAYLGLQGFEAQWRTLLELRRAGRLAGQYMRKQLEAQAASVDPLTVQRSPSLRFEIEGVDGGALVATKVDEIRPDSIQAPAALLGQRISGVSR